MRGVQSLIIRNRFYGGKWTYSAYIFPRQDAQRVTRSFLTCASLIIGDEILGGKTQEGNSYELAKKCFDSGIELKRIVVVPDIEQDIVSEVLKLAKNHDFVLTSGGIGPTHDDITYASIAKAFGLKLEYHEETLSKMRHMLSKKSKGTESKDTVLTSERKRMALLPCDIDSARQQVSVNYPDARFWVPIVTIRTQWGSRVSIFPGIPSLYKNLLDGFFKETVIPLLPPNQSGFVRCLIATSLPESEIATKLSVIQDEMISKGIKIGSYPNWQATIDPSVKERVIVSVVGSNGFDVNVCAELISQRIHGWIITSN